jgi:hypothetical protein
MRRECDDLELKRVKPELYTDCEPNGLGRCLGMLMNWGVDGIVAWYRDRNT